MKIKAKYLVFLNKIHPFVAHSSHRQSPNGDTLSLFSNRTVHEVCVLMRTPYICFAQLFHWGCVILDIPVLGFYSIVILQYQGISSNSVTDTVTAPTLTFNLNTHVALRLMFTSRRSAVLCFKTTHCITFKWMTLQCLETHVAGHGSNGDSVQEMVPKPSEVWY